MKASPNSFFHAALAAVLGLASALLLPWILPVDEMVYRWAQTDSAAQWVEYGGSLGAIITFVVGGILLAAIASLPEGRRTEIPRVAVAIGGAALMAELLKTGVERLRPRTVPFLETGNSFPSGHVMTTTVAALAACALVRATDWPRRWKVAAYAFAAAAVLAQACDRIALEAHWLSDLPASMLFAFAWFLATPILVVQSPRRIAVGTVAFVLAYAAVYADPALRIHLPSASASAGPPTWEIEVGEPGVNDRFVGSWTETTEKPLGAVAWWKQTEFEIPVDQEFEGGSIVKVLLRPPDCGQRQRQVDVRVTVALAGRDVATLGLRRGWREYRIAVPDDVRLVRGDRIALRFEPEPGACRDSRDPGVAAIRYMKIVSPPKT